MSAALWMPGATRMDIGNHAPTDDGPAKAVAHITWDRNATAAAPAALVPYEALVGYFGQNPTGMSMAPHTLWDPFTGRCAQFLPANSRSLSLVDLAGGTRTNRAGSVVIQVEALFFPYCEVDGKVYPRLVDTPCAGWDRLHAWIKSWGVPDVWPMGRPTDFTPNRSESTWETHAGWYGHQQVPENTHQDPGSWPGFTTPEADMPLSETDIANVAAACGRTVLGSPVAPVDGDDGTARSLAAVVGRSEEMLHETRADVAALTAAVGTLQAAVAALTANGLTDAQVAALAAALAPAVATNVANTLATRLEN